MRAGGDPTNEDSHLGGVSIQKQGWGDPKNVFVQGFFSMFILF